MMLQFNYRGFKTKRVVFEDVFNGLDTQSLEQMKELTAKRRLIEETINGTSILTAATAREMSGGLTSRNEQDLQRLEQYLPLLQNLSIKVQSNTSPTVIKSISDLRVRWTSSLASLPAFKLSGPKFYQIDSLNYELAMILFLYGLTLHNQAYEGIQDLQLSASLLKRSAGVFDYLNTEVLPSLQHLLPPEKPPETTTNLASAMSLICLAEAQAVAIKIAEKKGMSISLLSKLHYGITQFLDEASALLQLPSKCISRNFLEFIYCCRTLHELRSHRHLAECYKESQRMGIAIGLVNRVLKKELNMPGEDSWRKALKNELDMISEMLKKYDKENAFVWHEKPAPDFELPDLEGRKVVAAAPYEPQRWEREIGFKT